jgi:hypothetical protein
VFKGMFRNQLFVGILIFTVLAQYGLVEYGGEFVKTVHLDSLQWVKCILLGALSLPVGGLMRLIPAWDSESDFAPVSPLIDVKRHDVISTVTSHVNADEDSSRGFFNSFMFWLLVVTAIPVVTYQVFEEHWSPFLEPYLVILKAWAFAHRA